MSRGGKHSLISLFSGAMGLDLGLAKAGFQTLVANDTMEAAYLSSQKNNPGLPFIHEDIKKLSGKDLLKIAGLKNGELDMLAGGPPCQSFSTAGRRLSVDDKDNGPLIFDFVRMVDDLRPKCFLMENVKGILSASLKWRELPYNNNGKRIDKWYGTVLKDLIKAWEEVGYKVTYKLVNAADYGVPQTRNRVFFVGIRSDLLSEEFTFPSPTHSPEGDMLTKPYKTLGEAIGTITNDTSECFQFSDRKIKYLKKIPPGGNWRSLPPKIQEESMGAAFHAKGGRTGYWRRLSFDKPCPTLLTEPHNASTSLCHPEDTRPLSIAEYSAIQTFPKSWKFLGKRSDQYRMLGNAVPVELAKVLGREVITQILSQSKKRRKRPSSSSIDLQL